VPTIPGGGQEKKSTKPNSTPPDADKIIRVLRLVADDLNNFDDKLVPRCRKCLSTTHTGACDEHLLKTALKDKQSVNTLSHQTICTEIQKYLDESEAAPAEEAEQQAAPAEQNWPFSENEIESWVSFYRHQCLTKSESIYKELWSQIQEILKVNKEYLDMQKTMTTSLGKIPLNEEEKIMFQGVYDTYNVADIQRCLKAPFFSGQGDISKLTAAQRNAFDNTIRKDVAAKAKAVVSQARKKKIDAQKS
jgi:hypothetical protein